MIHCKKRELRLKCFFEPYNKIRLNISTSIDKPIELESGKSEGSYKANIYSALLSPSSPEWVEPALLEASRIFIKKTSLDAENALTALEASSYYQALLTLFQQYAEQAPKAVDSQDGLVELWLKIRNEYFPDREDIDEYRVIWTTRKQTSSLASCNVERKRVEVASPMTLEQSAPYLEALLYHEMCHAILGKPPVVNGRRVIHGKEFKALERQHPQIPELDNWIKSGGWDNAVKDYEIKLSA